MKGDRKGCPAFYATVLRGLYDSPTTTAGLSQRHGLTPTNASRVLRRMRSLKLVHIADWSRTPGRAAEALWGFGDEPDAQCLGATASRYAKMAPNKELTALAVALRMLGKEPVSASDLAEETGMHRQRVWQLLRKLRALRMVHIAEWDRTNPRCGPPFPLFSLGFDEPDTRRPKPLSDTVKERTYRQRRKANGGRRMRPELPQIAANASIFTLGQQAA